MSPNRRIFLNIIATYGRSLYALVCGLFISRWVLAALGKTDFGLYGVVGGMTMMALLAAKMRQTRISPKTASRAAKRALCGSWIAAVDDFCLSMEGHGGSSKL